MVRKHTEPIHLENSILEVSFHGNSSDGPLKLYDLAYTPCFITENDVDVYLYTIMLS